MALGLSKPASGSAPWEQRAEAEQSPVRTFLLLLYPSAKGRDVHTSVGDLLSLYPSAKGRGVHTSVSEWITKSYTCDVIQTSNSDAQQTWVSPEDIMLREISQPQKGKPCQLS